VREVEYIKANDQETIAHTAILATFIKRLLFSGTSHRQSEQIDHAAGLRIRSACLAHYLETYRIVLRNSSTSELSCMSYEIPPDAKMFRGSATYALLIHIARRSGAQARFGAVGVWVFSDARPLQICVALVFILAA
jgi:hypothetical protein